MTYHHAGIQNKKDDGEITRKQKWSETESKGRERRHCTWKRSKMTRETIIRIRKAYVIYAHLIQIYRIDTDK